jgi:hypothetical protein
MSINRDKPKGAVKRYKLTAPVEENKVAKPDNSKVPPADHLLLSQLSATAPALGNESSAKALAEIRTHQLYRGLDPQDTSDAILSALAAGTTNMTFQAYALAQSSTGYPEIWAMYCKYGLKGAALTSDLLMKREKHRGQKRGNVTVGKVNIESGGQAIVGNVESGRRDKPDDDQEGGKNS